MVNPHSSVSGAEVSSALTVPADPAIAAMSSLRFRIAGDVVAAAVKELPDEARAAIKWFAGYCRSRNLGQEEMSQLLKKDNGTYYSYHSLYAVLTGRRVEQGASVEPVVKAIIAFRRQVEGQSRVGDSGFIATRLSSAIWDRCDRARKRAKIGFIIGDSQIGKTVSLVEYARAHNHGETIYVEAPSGGSKTGFLDELSATLAIPQMHRMGDLHKRIIECFDPKMLLIVDEAHRFLHAGRGVHALDFIRELYNRAGCGVVLAMTNEGLDLLHKGQFRVRLQQLWRRRIAPLRLPASVPTDDLALFAAAYELSPAGPDPVTVRTKYCDEHGAERERDYTARPSDLQQRVIGEEGLGVWLTILQDAADLSKTQRRSISWAAVLKAYCVMQADGEVLL